MDDSSNDRYTCSDFKKNMVLTMAIKVLKSS